MTTDSVDVATDSVRFRPAGAVALDRYRFELQVETDELRYDGRPVDLRPQAARALSLLVRRAGRLVTFDELRAELWGDQHLEWRNSLHQCVRDLRRALSDDARHPRFVATVPRKGYRFVGERSPAAVPMSRFGGVVRTFRRPSRAFAAGIATAVLVPASLFALCVILASSP